MANSTVLPQLQSLHKPLYHQISLTIPPYLLQTSRSTRQYHLLHYILPQPSTTAYQHSYLYRTINDWNKLPINLIEFTDTDSFKNELLIPQILCYAGSYMHIYVLIWLYLSVYMWYLAHHNQLSRLIEQLLTTNRVHQG